MDALQDEQLSNEQHPAAGEGQERNDDAPQLHKDETPLLIQNALRDLVRKFERESDVVRRHHVRRFLRAEEMWKGNQHLIWSERNFGWRTPFDYALEQGQAPKDLPKYQYVTNIYQAFGLTVIAAISQRLPKVRFSPKSAKSERDIATARAASSVSEVIEDNNNLDMLSVRYAYLMWTQGLFGAYVRYVLDKDFGTQDLPKVEMQPVKVADDRYSCPTCGAETPADEIGAVGLSPQQPACPACGYQLSENDFQAEEYGEGPVVTGTYEYPNGQEVITVYGALNLKVMPTATTQKETAYLILVEEQHRASVRAAYPTKASKIGEGGLDAEGTFEKNARIGLSDSPTNGNARGGSLTQAGSQVTLTRAWLRNWALWAVDDDDIRQELLTTYPDGVMVVFADDDFMEARNEDLDAHWELCSPMPGQGMYREAVGGSLIPIQQRLNDATNVQAEHIEFGSAPPVFFDARYINRKSLEERRMQPANFFPIVTQGAPAGTDITKLMYQPEMKIDSNIYQYGRDLVNIGQTISGALPTIFGGPLEGNETAKAYGMSRDQALGKLTLFWRSVKQFHARLMLKAVECFRENRTDDVERVIYGKSGDYTSKWIHLEDLRGNITAKPEVDEDFPASWSEIRENIISLIQQVPEIAQQILMHPANAPMMRKFIANPDLVLPMEDDREKQYREIDELLQGQPQTNPQTGAMAPSVMPDPLSDNHDAHVATLQEFCVSDEGIEAKKTNPAGYSNLQLHIVAHYEAKAQATAEVQAINSGAMNQANPQPAAPQGSPDGAAPGASADTPSGDAGATLGDKIEQAVPGAGDAIQSALGAKMGGGSPPAAPPQ